MTDEFFYKIGARWIESFRTSHSDPVLLGRFLFFLYFGTLSVLITVIAVVLLKELVNRRKVA